MRCTLQVLYLSDDDQASHSIIAEGCGLRQVRHSRVQAYPFLLAARSDNQKIEPWPSGNVQAHGVCSKNT